MARFRVHSGRVHHLTVPRKGGVALVSLTDADGTETLDGAAALDLKRRGEGGVLRYQVKKAPQTVSITVERIPQNKVHRSFYPQTIVSTVISELQRAPGSYDIALRPDRVRDNSSNELWTGRDDGEACRLLLGGRYRIKIVGVDSSGREASDTKLLEIAAPTAILHGPWFPQHFTEAEEEGPVSNLDDSTNAAAILKKLGDGSSFACELVEISRAKKVMHGLRHESALFSYSGHGSTGRIWFYDNDQDAAEKTSATTLLVTHTGCAVLDGNDRTYVPQSIELPKSGKPLRDVLLVFLNTCYAGGGDAEDNMALRMIELGADFVVGFSKSIYFPVANDFTKDFFKRCSKGEPIVRAARSAIRYADKRNAWIYSRTEPKAESFIKLYVAPRVPEPHTLVPARYGCGRL